MVSLHVFDRTGTKFRRIERDAVPLCQVHFCDTCGDCLHCHAEDPCGGNEGEPHAWVQYGELCDLCNGTTTERHCKIVCNACGFTRDCSDP